jgi:class 3 adenylate cyclase
MVDTAELVVGLVAFGMAVAFVSADPQSPTSRALAGFFGFLGVISFLTVGVRSGWLPFDPWLTGRLFTLASTATFLAAFEWLVRVQRTEATDGSPSPRGTRLLRMSQGLAGLHGLLGIAYPALRDEAFIGVQLSRPGYYLFAVPLYLSLALAMLSIAQLLRANPDHAERVRLRALLFATPFLIAALFVPAVWSPVTTALGELIFLVGAVRYHVLQGQRGQFLARFLSPQVARLVRERGLVNATQRSRVQLSVVVCDLRGFTAFSETAAPEEVMQLLEQYYDAIGAAVTQCDATIKDFAGDGILALVGAPIPFVDHAQRAVSMALRMRESGSHVLSRWQKLGLDLGLGVGIASGYVTVGTIGGERRLEYAAVGPPVNLAARLCALAESGQILADQRTVGLAGEDGTARRFEKLDPVMLKGFTRPVAVFAVGA